MSFTAIAPTAIEAGKPVSSTVGELIRTNFNDHESRLTGVENGTTTVYQPILLRVNGPYANWGAKTSVIKTTTNFPLTFTGARLIIDLAGASGTTEIDIKFKRGSDPWTSIFTTLPSVAFGAGDDAISSNAVLHSTNKILQAGDLIRLDITSVQVGAVGFMVRLDFNKS